MPTTKRSKKRKENAVEAGNRSEILPEPGYQSSNASFTLPGTLRAQKLSAPVTLQSMLDLCVMSNLFKRDDQLSCLEHVAGYRNDEHRTYFVLRVRQLLTDLLNSSSEQGTIVVFERAMRALQALCYENVGHPPSEAIRLTIVASKHQTPRPCSSDKVIGQIPQDFNVAQKDAVKLAIGNPVCLIKGPPGTGKTKVSIRIIANWVQNNSRCVLATSACNEAVDSITRGLLRVGLRAVRLGSLSARAEDLHWYTLPPGAQGAKELKRAQVVCVTALSCMKGVLEHARFSHVLFDEAAQATEIITVVPICKGASQICLGWR